MREPGSEDRICVGRRERADLRGALRGAPRQGDGAAGRGRRVRRRRLRGRRPGAPDRGPGRHREPLARALREDALHRPDGGASSSGCEPDALVLHAPSVVADPDEDGTRTETFVVLHPTRSEVVIGGTFYAGEIKKSIFTLMNDRLPLEGVLPMHCSANVDDDGSRRDLLRALRDREDDPVRRSRAPPDRRRRARLGRRGHLQLRGRLLREGHPALRRGRARDLPDDAARSGPCSRTSSSTSRACSTSTTTRRPRTRAPRTSSSRSRTRCRRSVRGIRGRSCSSPRTRSGSCRRSRA